MHARSFIRGPIRELIQAHGVRDFALFKLLVVLVDGTQALLEDLESLGVFLVRIRLSMFLLKISQSRN